MVEGASVEVCGCPTLIYGIYTPPFSTAPLRMANVNVKITTNKKTIYHTIKIVEHEITTSEKTIAIILEGLRKNMRKRTLLGT